MDRIIVAGRIRPLSKVEIDENEEIVLQHDRNKENTLYIQGAYTTKQFKLDRVLTESSTQMDVFEIIHPILKSTLNGINATVFAYGQTGTG